MKNTDIYKFAPCYPLYGDDVKILDFLANLQDREILRSLDRFIKMADGGSVCMLNSCPLDGMVVLILYRAPFFPDPDNRLVLYYCKDLRGMFKYFKGWLDASSEVENDTTGALREITRLVCAQWAELGEDKTPRLVIGD